jgi:ABC-type multidrug transport system fused ATPase/permease subunit
MPQTAALFGRTIREAIIGPSAMITDSQVWAVLAKVGMQKRVSSLPDGLDTEISEGGKNLSSGERQLICLARALVTACAVLICDEATASIDISTDEIVTTALLQLPCTVLFICHRLQRVREFDLVIVMADKKIAEFGRPKDLMSKEGGLLAAMVRKAELDVTLEQ